MSEAVQQAERFYQQVILRHSRDPSHGRRLACYDASGAGDNPLCGDRVQVFVRHDAAGLVAACGFEARGCAISVASADLMAALAAGSDAGQLRRLAAAFHHLVATGAPDPACAAELATLLPLAGVHAYPSRHRCATLPWHALLQALAPEGAEVAA